MVKKQKFIRIREKDFDKLLMIFFEMGKQDSYKSNAIEKLLEVKNDLFKK